MSVTGTAAAGGALWGTLIGLLFLNPLAGLATGAVAGKLTDVGINDDTIRQIGAQLQQDKAAVLVLARSATVDTTPPSSRPT